MLFGESGKPLWELRWVTQKIEKASGEQEETTEESQWNE